MSTETPRTPEERIERAVQEVYALAAGRAPGGHTFRMSVPADPRYDSDLILIDGLTAAEEVVASLRKPGQPPAPEGEETR
jgi:hypothetical protein